MPEDRSATYQLQTQQGKWLGALEVQKGHATIGGKVYPTVKMPDGSVWMAQNLDMTWEGLTTLTDYTYVFSTDVYSAYWEFDQQNYGSWGRYYNARAFYYLENNSSTLCPGWHVPDKNDLGFWDTIYPASFSDNYGFNLSVYGHGEVSTRYDTRGWYTGTSYNNNVTMYGLLFYNAVEANCRYVSTSDGTSYSRGQLNANAQDYNYKLYPIRLVMDDPSQFVPDTIEHDLRTQYTKYWRPQITFEFSESDFNPNRKGLFNTEYGNRNNFIWTKVSDSPNRWRLDVGSKNGIITAGDQQYGLALLCATKNGSTVNGLLTSTQLGTCTCKIVGFGNMDNIETMDRSFMNCTSLTQIPSSIPFGGYVANVAQMFAGCTEVTGGALALYNQLKDVTTITNHADTFKDCGLNTVTGLAELQQIPLSWGGLLAPPSTTMTCTRVESSNPKVKWSCGSTAPDWSTNPELYVFTSESVSQYAGVNMKRASTTNTQNNFATSGVEAYYRIAFVQFASGTSGAITWALTTSGYNGKLDASATAGDMPGTLSYDNYGATDLHYGTYDSSKQVYVCFLVTNAAPDSWQGLSDAYALQGNNFYKESLDFKWFTD